ncbi:MAG: zinc ABC transporter substrate-binding protein [Chloroflexi bacterium]|nr:zinc ABC transporter substrate-binding protein [Chloroflexota bacterium]
MSRFHPITMALAILFLVSCTGAGQEAEGDDRMPVVATTSIVAAVVSSIGGEFIAITLLLPLGTDPHTFEPRPQDVAAISDARLVFANGAGLEEFLQPLLESVGPQERLVEVSRGMELLPFSGEVNEEAGAGHTEEDGFSHEGGDPHTWMDPNNVLLWVDEIVAALSAADPAHAAEYETNAARYRASLLELDGWIRGEAAQVPPENRLFVSDHAVFGYFCEEYGFTQVGTITASFSANVAPSARDLAALEDSIRQSGARAVFVGESANPQLAAQVAEDTGIALVTVYHASLSEAGGPAAN